MKHSEDKMTIDMLGRPRGRPPKQNPLTDAQRQKLRRERLRKAGKGFISASVDWSLIERIDALRQLSGADKNVVIEDLLRHALDSMHPATAQGAESGNAAP